MAVIEHLPISKSDLGPESAAPATPPTDPLHLTDSSDLSASGAADLSISTPPADLHTSGVGLEEEDYPVRPDILIPPRAPLSGPGLDTLMEEEDLNSSGAAMPTITSVASVHPE